MSLRQSIPSIQKNFPGIPMFLNKLESRIHLSNEAQLNMITNLVKPPIEMKLC